MPTANENTMLLLTFTPTYSGRSMINSATESFRFEEIAISMEIDEIESTIIRIKIKDVLRAIESALNKIGRIFNATEPSHNAMEDKSSTTEIESGD